MPNKYKDISLGTVEAVFNKLGGIEEIESFLRGNMEITVVKHTIDLSKPPRLLFDYAEVVKHDSEINGKKVVEIELRLDDNLYIDGKKVVLHLSERQMGDKVVEGHELREELESGEQVFLNSNVLDYIYKHPALFPRHWKKNEQGESIVIYFWGSIFRNTSDVYLYVPYLYWDGDLLIRQYHWLGSDWDRLSPSVSVAS